MHRSARAGADWGHVLLVLGFAALTVFYLHDAWQASSRVRNLILILPASIVALVLCVIVLVGIFREARTAAPEPQAEAPAGEAREPFLVRYRTGAVMALFAAYILTLPWLGFDVGTAAFVAANLVLNGERRIVPLVVVPVVFAAAATLAFRWLLPYPMPILLL